MMMVQKILPKFKLIFIPCKENRYRPKVLDTKFLLYYLIFLFTLKILIIPFVIYFPKNIFFAEITNNAIIEFTNRKRELSGLSFLKENPTLDRAAYLKAQNMLEKSYFSHKSPEGISPWYWFKIAGYDYKFAGENLAIGFLDSEEVIEGWYDSPSHKNNLLNQDYQEIGVAVLKGDFQGNEATVVVQLFGTEKTKVSPPPPSTTETPRLPSAPTSSTSTEEIPQPPFVSGEQATLEEKTLTEKFPEKIEPKNLRDKTEFKFFNFLNLKYYNLIQEIIYLSLILVIGYLLTAVLFDALIYRKFVIDYKDLIPKAIGFTTVLMILLLIDKPELISLIPHNFQIF